MAGLALGLELSRQGVGTLVLESGGYQADDKTRDLYRGESTGIPYFFADGCRSRFLGGSSNCWGGWCRPFCRQDFEARSWIPHSGWPITLDDLMPYYSRAQKVLRMGPVEYNPDYWVNKVNREDVRRLPLPSEEIEDIITQFSPPARLGIDYMPALKSSTNLSVFLYANVVDIETCPELKEVRRVQVKTLSGRQISVTAKKFVLATGGIENARLMLACNKQASAGLGNANDLVGRFFMEHPRTTTAEVVFKPEWRKNKLYDHRYHYHNPQVGADGICIAGQFAVTEGAQRREGLMNCSSWFYSELQGERSGPGDALVNIKHRMLRKARPETSMKGDISTIIRHPVDTAGYLAGYVFPHPALMHRTRIRTICEPNPDPDSRVTLSATEKDALGIPRVEVNWKLDNKVRNTFNRSVEMLKDALEAGGAAKVTLEPRIPDGEWPDTFEHHGTWHHMGTTRMHDSPKKGVVDRNCRVHGMNNLFIAGSSVFTTGGANYPSLTLTALAMRLADRIVTELQPVATMIGSSPFF